MSVKAQNRMIQFWEPKGSICIQEGAIIIGVWEDAILILIGV